MADHAICGTEVPPDVVSLFVSSCLFMNESALFVT